MKLPDILNTKAVAYGVGIVVIGGVLYFFGKKLLGAAGDALATVGTALNPVNEKNLANRAVGAIGAAVTGDEHWSLGGAIYDLFHPYDPNTPTRQVAKGLPIRPEDRPTNLR
jgi:hypothetical protein